MDHAGRGHGPPNSHWQGHTRVELLTLGCGHWPSPDMPRAPPRYPHVAHLLGKLTRKAKATVSRKLKVLSLYSSSPTEFSQHWCRGACHHPWSPAALHPPMEGTSVVQEPRLESDRWLN